MSDDQITTAALTLGFVVALVFAVWAMIGIVAIYREEGGKRSVLFKSLIVTDTISLALGVIAFPLASAVLLGDPPPPWSGPLLSLVMLGLMSMSTVHRVIFERIRRAEPENRVSAPEALDEIEQ